MHIKNRKADIALIGLAVMGQNLILNMNDKGFVVCAYNRTVDKVRIDKLGRIFENNLQQFFISSALFT
jgi:6-phosphogluconate dehydrogenase